MSKWNIIDRLHILSNKYSCFNLHILRLVLLIQGKCAMIYILATWIFITHFEFIVNINISSLSAAKSAYGSNGRSECPPDYPPFYVTCWSSSLSLLHAPALSIPLTIWAIHYSLYVCMGTSAYFSVSLQFLLSSFCLFSPILSFFSSVSLLSSLSLARAVASSFYPLCFSLFSSNYLSRLLLSFPLYTCFYIINADIRTWRLAPFHPTVLLFDRSRTACQWWWASYIVLLVTMFQWALLQIRVKISN